MDSDNEVLDELMQNRTYLEILGAFAYNVATSTDWRDGEIVIGPYDQQTLYRLGIIDKRGGLTTRGYFVRRSIGLDAESLEHGTFQIKRFG